jgi:hypothetical protein
MTLRSLKSCVTDAHINRIEIHRKMTGEVAQMIECLLSKYEKKYTEIKLITKT